MMATLIQALSGEYGKPEVMSAAMFDKHLVVLAA
jgi:hypothetical protein